MLNLFFFPETWTTEQLIQSKYDLLWLLIIEDTVGQNKLVYNMIKFSNIGIILSFQFI